MITTTLLYIVGASFVSFVLTAHFYESYYLKILKKRDTTVHNLRKERDDYRKLLEEFDAVVDSTRDQLRHTQEVLKKEKVISSSLRQDLGREVLAGKAQSKDWDAMRKA